MEKNPLLQFGNIPITTDVLESCYRNMASPAKKVQALEKDGQIIRLKRGMYVVNPELSGKEIDSRLCANHLYGPSYVSIQWALRWYGLIPERVYLMTSVTTKRSRQFFTPIGNYSYRQVPLNYFHIGIRMVEENGVCCLMASPEKALCDTIFYDSFVPDQSMFRLSEYLEEDMRFDMDELPNMDLSIFEACAAAGVKSKIFTNLIKLIKKL